MKHLLASIPLLLLLPTTLLAANTKPGCFSDQVTWGEHRAHATQEVKKRCAKQIPGEGSDTALRKFPASGISSMGATRTCRNLPEIKGAKGADKIRLELSITNMRPAHDEYPALTSARCEEMFLSWVDAKDCDQGGEDQQDQIPSEEDDSSFKGGWKVRVDPSRGWKEDGSCDPVISYN